MTVDVPAAAHPMRFALPVVAALASAGVVTVTAQPFIGNTLIFPGPDIVTLLAAIIAVVMVVVPAAAVAMRPALGRAGGWPIVAVGLGVGALVLQAAALGGAVGVVAVLLIVAVVGGFAAALGGLMVVAASAPAAEAVAVAAGVAFGFAGQRYNLSLFTFGSPGGIFGYTLPFYLVIGLALVASAMAFNRPRPDASRGGSAAVVPVLIVAGVAGLIQLGHYLRWLVVDEFRVSAAGLASPRRVDTVGAFSEYSAIGLAALAGLILLWLGYRRGKADLARWVALGFALSGPSLVVKFGFAYGGPTQTSGLVVTALLAAAAGVALALRADRFFPWDALGAAVAAVGMIIGSVSYRVGPSSSALAALLIIGGFAFALASGLTRIVRVTPATTDKAVSLSLGFVAMLAAADAISPAAWSLLGSSGFDRFQLSVPITSLVGAGVVLALFGFSRAVDRVRREIREQAEEQ